MANGKLNVPGFSSMLLDSSLKESISQGLHFKGGCKDSITSNLKYIQYCEGFQSHTGDC